MRVYICTPVIATDNMAVEIQIFKYAEMWFAGSGSHIDCADAARIARHPVAASVAGPYPRNWVLWAICLRMLLISQSALCSSLITLLYSAKYLLEDQVVKSYLQKIFLIFIGETPSCREREGLLCSG